MSQSEAFSIWIEDRPFTLEEAERLSHEPRGRDWPIVYILTGKGEAYVGETQDASSRMRQHLANPERRRLTRVSLMTSGSFNKSAILDLESLLIEHMHADGLFRLQNLNAGQSRYHDYYQRLRYQDLFEELWEKLRKRRLAQHSLFDIRNSEIFKYSPYKRLTRDQYALSESLLEVYAGLREGERKEVLVHGGAGTGKTLVATYFLRLLEGILDGDYDSSDLEEDEDSFGRKVRLVEAVKRKGKPRIALIEPIGSFRKTMKEVFRGVPSLRHIPVIGPSEATYHDWDVLVVDEAHRLRRRDSLNNFGTHDQASLRAGFEVRKGEGPERNATELDWLRRKAGSLLVLFYDEGQSVKECDVRREDFRKIEGEEGSLSFRLNAQLRVKGGDFYMAFAKSLLSPSPTPFPSLGEGDAYDFRVYDDFAAMFEDIKRRNEEYGGLCRVLAGKCRSLPWRREVRDRAGKKSGRDYDFLLQGKPYSWNKEFSDSKFITDDRNIDLIGCLDTAQGYDLNYAGVVLGDEVRYDREKDCLYIDLERVDRKSKALSKDADEALRNVVHAYEVLLTRGIRGTYVFAMDEEAGKFLKSLLPSEGVR